jgi:hypothetical protein
LAHPTGFFFKGSRYYAHPIMAFLSVCNMIVGLVSFFILFTPILAGTYIEADLILDAFNIPGSFPWNLNKNGGISKAPGPLSRLLGNDYERRHEMLFNVSSFVDQVKEIEILNATSCGGGDIVALLECGSENEPQPIIIGECSFVASPSDFDVKKFGAISKAVYTLKAIKPMVEVPNDQKIVCRYQFDDDFDEEIHKVDSQIIKFQSHYFFKHDPHANLMVPFTVSYNELKYSKFMEVKRDTINRMLLKLNEITENFYDHSGDFTT